MHPEANVGMTPRCLSAAPLPRYWDYFHVKGTNFFPQMTNELRERQKWGAPIIYKRQSSRQSGELLIG